MRRYSSGFPQIGSPRTLIEPLLGLSCPVISFMNVLLPAPFGPSRPVTPGGTLTVMSLRPLTCPYHLDSFSAATIGVPAAVTITRPPRRRARVVPAPRPTTPPG